MALKSEAVVFGPDANLVGVVTLAEPAARPDLAFIMFNSGVLPRLGPHRMNVKIAERLARHGVSSLRFDLAGFGDSRVPNQSLDFRQQAVADVRSAMDMMEGRYGVRRFALIGVCSGALTVYTVADEDPRVAGVLMFDGYCYLTKWTKWVKYFKRARTASASRWVSAIRNRLRRNRGPAPGASPNPVAIMSADAVTPTPPKESFARVMDQLLARGASVFVVFSGSFIDFYSYRNQFRDAFAGFDFVRRIRCEYRADIDHTFVLLDTQARMLDLVSSWVPEVEQAAGPSR
ncbi:MAG: alpha/beta fold hydrolase [Steroidobacteraceae bacterium]